MFDKLRQEDGLSGFPNPAESEYDVFSVGHAGTSIATALGMALGAQQRSSDEKIVALVGDASIVNGLSFEALNNLGLAKRQMLIILNDNSMAIDVTQGAMAKFLSKVRLSHTYEDIRNTTANILEHLPLVGKRMEEALENFKKTLRMAISPSRLFESMNIPYFGPVDGHDIGSLIELFKAISHLNTPAILHVYTKKGKGYEPADDNPRKFHSTGPFQINGCNDAQKKGRSFTQAFGDALVSVGEKNKKVVAITAAMPDGTGLVKFREKFKSRYYDVGIAESIAVDLGAGLAKQGLRPIVCIYSTFLQRSIDQVFQEVSLQNLPVIFCIDRAGVVGDDGPTHHGVMDIGFLRTLPNLVFAAPADEYEINQALAMAVEGDKPFAIRYPRDAVKEMPKNTEIAYELGKSAVVRQGDSEFVIVTIGPLLNEAIESSDILEKEGLSVTVVNGRFVKPIDPAIFDLFENGKTVIIAEDNSIAAGFGSAVIEQALKEAAIRPNHKMHDSIGKAVLLGAPDAYLPPAKRHRQLEWMGVTAEKLVKTIKTLNLQTENVDI